MAMPKQIRRVNPDWCYAFRAAHGLRSGVYFTSDYISPAPYIMVNEDNPDYIL